MYAACVARAAVDAPWRGCGRGLVDDVLAWAIREGRNLINGPVPTGGRFTAG